MASQDQEIIRLQGLCKREGQLTAELGTQRQRRGALPTLQAESDRLQILLETESYALEARAVLAAFTAEIAAVGYDETAHRALGERISALSEVEGRRAQLEKAREELGRATAEIAAGEGRILGLIDERARLAAEREPLLAATNGMAALAEDLQLRRADLQLLQRRVGDLQVDVGRLRRQIEEGAIRAEERDATKVAREEAERQAWAHKELATAFGRRGIPAMLIENALPELEQDANELLARMTDNSTQVQFVTQRQGTGGKVTEVLEIRIADNLGTRTYEMFSGGEAFRIDFAIRIALSKLLARRAGAELSFLLVDEGFGSQDSQGRDRLVEAITSIADDFEKILVVTHIDDLKELFDVHIEVSKGPSGSQITISAA
jgi:exonuclease SbcC